MFITPEYKEQLSQLHKKEGSWGTTGVFWAARIQSFIEELNATSVLDYGCGKGYLLEALARSLPAWYAIQAYDPGVEDFARDPSPADIVTCTDVLEHVEPDCLVAVLEHISRLSIKGAFFVISTRKAKAILPDGRNAHLIIEGPDFWTQRLAPFYNRFVIDFREGPQELIVKAWK